MWEVPATYSPRAMSLTSLHKSIKKAEVCDLHRLTCADFSKHVVALLRERHLSDRVADVAALQQVLRILPGFTPVGETFHISLEPVDNIRT